MVAASRPSTSEACNAPITASVAPAKVADGGQFERARRINRALQPLAGSGTGPIRTMARSINRRITAS